MEFISLLLPILAIIVTGFLFARFNLLPEGTGDRLIQFAMWVAIPALLFSVIAQEPFEKLLNPAFFICFGGSVLIVSCVVFAYVRLWLQKPLSETTLTAFMAVGSNTAFVALPVLHAMFGHKAVLPTAIATLILIILILITSILLDRFQTEPTAKRPSIALGFGRALLNPLVLSSVLGVAYAATGLPLPDMVKQYLGLLAMAVTPCALFAIGLSIRLGDLSNDAGVMVAISVIKLVVFPASVLGLAVLLHLDPILTIAATICAAVPVGKTVFVLAQAHHDHPERVAATITMSSVASVLTLAAWLTLLAYLFPNTVPQ